jgi:hypothetical protein
VCPRNQAGLPFSFPSLQLVGAGEALSVSDLLDDPQIRWLDFG